MEKWQFLDQNHLLTPLGKFQSLDFLNFLFLLLRKEFFRSGISLKKFSRHILPKKKKLEKWPFLDHNHGLTPLEKCHFFNFFFLFLRKTFSRCGISLKTFSLPILPKKKNLEKWPFLNQNHGLTNWKKVNFTTF